MVADSSSSSSTEIPGGVAASSASESLASLASLQSTEAGSSTSSAASRDVSLTSLSLKTAADQLPSGIRKENCSNFLQSFYVSLF
jgi:hypothetical protein